MVSQTLLSQPAILSATRGCNLVNTFKPGRGNVEHAPEKAAPEKKELRRNLIKAMLLAALLVTVLAVVRFSPLAQHLRLSNLQSLQQELAEFGGLAPVVFLLGGALVITLGVPRAVVSILGGLAFGLLWGIVMALTAALLGSTVIFLLTKWLGRPLFKQKVGGYLRTIENYSKTHGFLLVVILRQLPLTSLLINVLIGLTSISMGSFILGSVVGLLPEILIFVLFGSSLQESFVLRVSIASTLWIILIIAAKFFLQRSPLAQAVIRKLKTLKTTPAGNG
jgi:uncharacterized membrane protein YdjX (TVP38/TMEM64 family)